MLNNQDLVRLENWLKELDLPQKPACLYDPIRYILQLGGKRVRPLVLLAVAGEIDLGEDDAKTLALAIELFHNFTLVHDDIMDESDKRRGHETVHVKWNQNVGILSGDAMLIEVYKLLIDLNTEHKNPLIKRFNAIATLVCEGQQLDMDFEEMDQVTVGDYLDMIRKKTAVLLAHAMEAPAIATGQERLANCLYHVGENIGLAFQIKDDLLDAFPEDDKFGKKVAGDIYNAKKTLLYLELLNRLDDLNRNRVIEIYNQDHRSPSDVEWIRSLMLEHKVDEFAMQKASEYSQKAIALVGEIEHESLKAWLLNFSDALLARSY